MCIHLERKIVGMEDKKDGMVKSGDSQSTTIYGREIWTNNYYQRSLSANKWKKKGKWGMKISHSQYLTKSEQL